MNLPAIGDALAVRFAAAAITPPAGYQDIRLSTSSPPQNVIGLLPCVVVFPPGPGEIEHTYGTSSMMTTQTWHVLMLYGAVTEIGRAVDACTAWLNVLITQLVGHSQAGSIQLGEADDGVTWARITDSGIGAFEYSPGSGETFAGCSLTVTVSTAEGITPVA